MSMQRTVVLAVANAHVSGPGPAHEMVTLMSPCSTVAVQRKDPSAQTLLDFHLNLRQAYADVTGWTLAQNDEADAGNANSCSSGYGLERRKPSPLACGFAAGVTTLARLHDSRRRLSLSFHSAPFRLCMSR
jgi:hypothetical protein